MKLPREKKKTLVGNLNMARYRLGKTLAKTVYPIWYIIGRGTSQEDKPQWEKIKEEFYMVNV